MNKLYINLTVILIVFFANSILAEQNLSKETNQPLVLPADFKEFSSPTITLNNSIFYNQMMEKRSLENFDNRFMIVHFWATWCMDCQNELIMLNKLQKEFRKKPLLVLAISEDFKDVSAIDEFFTKHKIDFLDIYIDKKNSIYKFLGINHIPATYLLDFNGDIIASSSPGIPVNWEDENIKKYLEAKVNNHHLLPPEFKNARDPFVSSNETKVSKPINQQDKPKILIN